MQRVFYRIRGYSIITLEQIMSNHIEVAFNTQQGPGDKLLRSFQVLGIVLVRAKSIFRWTRSGEAAMM